MSREDLSAMLTELADEVQPQPQAARAWAKARHVRRRRAVIGAAAAVLLVATTMALVQLPRVADKPVDTPTPTPTGMARIDKLPATIPAAADAAPYWPSSLNPPADAPTFQEAPLSHAVLLFQPESAGPIYAYGEGSINGGSGNGQFQWVRVAESLEDVRDAGGNRSTPVDLNSLGPMGESAAFAQTDELVVVNLIDGTTQRTQLSGFNEDVTWLPDRRHLFVTAGTQTWLTATDHVVGPVAVSGWDVTPLVGAALGLTTMSIAESGAPLVVRRYDDEGRAEISNFEVDQASAAGYRVSYLAPRGWREGNLIAQAASGQVDNHPGDFVIVVDDRPEAVTHVLDLGDGRNKLCCAVVGWEGAETVLVRTDQDGVLRWHLPTGTVTRLTASAPGALSIAPMGCVQHVEIEGQGFGCVE